MLKFTSITSIMIKFGLAIFLVVIGCTVVCCKENFNVDECFYNLTGKSSGEIHAKGKINSSMTCTWHVVVNTENKTKNVATVHLKELYLDDEDSVVFYLPDATETLFGPFHGSIGSIVVFVEQDDFFINLTTSSKNMTRKFDAFYMYDCNIPVSDLQVISSPHYKSRGGKRMECQYIFLKPLFKSRSLVFQGLFNPKSSVNIGGSDGQDGSYSSNFLPDIFGKNQIIVNLSLEGNSTENMFTIYNREILSDCSGYLEVKEGLNAVLTSYAKFKLNNDSVPHECRWLIKASDKSPILGMVFDKLQFSSVLDTLVINDGPSEMSSALYVAARANQNDTESAVIRSSGTYLWVSFRSLEFSSNFSGNISVHGQGGYLRGQGSISMKPTVGNDTIFMLEVNANETVLLNITQCDFKPPAKLTIYEEFDYKSNWLAQFHGNVWAPVVSRTSKMMLVAEKFNSGKFDAMFHGIMQGCMHTSPPTSDSYVLSGNCNSTCVWTIPPLNQPGGVVQLQFQYLSLSGGDELQVVKLDENKTLVTSIGSNITQVPQMSLRADEGFYVSVKRGDCARKEDVILIAHSTYHSACSKDIVLRPATDVQIASPGYPDTYPLLSNCQWNITSSSASDLIHLTFNKLQLAPNHCINITQIIHGQKGSIQQVFMGDYLPDDLLNAAAAVQFNAFNCHDKSDKLSLISGEGFSLRATSADCGGTMNGATGTFGTEGFPKPSNKSNLCMWKVQVPSKDKDSSNLIIFNVDIKDSAKNYILKIYNGASVRDVEITNITSNEIWSRNYTVLFEYRRINFSIPSAAINITYRTMSCNSTMKCQNGICMHPDWLCNDKNDCGDNTDELKCNNPSPQKETKEGISSVTYGVSIVCFFLLGVAATMGIPYLIQRYRNGRYHQFRDLSDGN